MGALFGGVSVALGGRDGGHDGRDGDKKGGWEPFSGISIKL